MMEEIKKLSPKEFEKLFDVLSRTDEEAAFRALKERCLYDLEIFCLAFFPHFCGHAFNQFHRDCFEKWREHTRKDRDASAAPRGSAKSTFVALIKPIHDVCYGLEKYIVVFSNTEGQAAAKLKDIRRELLENKFLNTVYGSFFSSKKVAETNFVATCDESQTMFSAFGSGTEVRGIRFGPHRPSKIIGDDVEHSDEVFNEEIRAKYAEWFREEVSQLGDENSNISVIGTILHKKSLLSGLLRNPAYKSSMYKSVINWSERTDLWEKWKQIYHDLENDRHKQDAELFFADNSEAMLKGTQVLWPEKEDYYALMALREEIGHRAFMKERQNDPLADDQAIFINLHWYVEKAEGLLIERTGVLVPWSELKESCYGVIDPSTGQTKAKAGKLGDFACRLTGYKDYRNRLFVHADSTKRQAPSAYIDGIFEDNDFYQYAKYGVETNLYRNLLLPNIMAEKKRREAARQLLNRKDYGIRIPFYDITNTENKEKRIFTLEPKTTNGYILFNKSMSEEFKSQLESFPLGEHDDGPDALEMLWGLANNRYKATPLDSNPYGGK